MSEQNKPLAEQVCDTLCRAMTAENWRYERKEEDGILILSYGAKGKNGNMEFNVFIEEETRLLSLISDLPFTVDDDKMMDMAIALSVVNDKLLFGCFDMDLSNGNISFRVCQPFTDDSVLGEKLMMRLVVLSACSVDEFALKLSALNAGIISIEDFLKA